MRRNWGARWDRGRVQRRELGSVDLGATWVEFLPGCVALSGICDRNAARQAAAGLRTMAEARVSGVRSLERLTTK
jgi:predicted aminopeptidase